MCGVDGCQNFEIAKKATAHQDRAKEAFENQESTIKAINNPVLCCGDIFDPQMFYFQSVIRLHGQKHQTSHCRAQQNIQS